MVSPYPTRGTPLWDDDLKEYIDSLVAERGVDDDSVADVIIHGPLTQHALGMVSEALVLRAGATPGQVPTLRPDGTLAFRWAAGEKGDKGAPMIVGSGAPVDPGTQDQQVYLDDVSGNLYTWDVDTIAWVATGQSLLTEDSFADDAGDIDTPIGAALAGDYIRPRVPISGGRTVTEPSLQVNIRDEGAKSDAESFMFNSGTIIQGLMGEVGAQGGGDVVVPDWTPDELVDPAHNSMAQRRRFRTNQTLIIPPGVRLRSDSGLMFGGSQIMGMMDADVIRFTRDANQAAGNNYIAPCAVIGLHIQGKFGSTAGCGIATRAADGTPLSLQHGVTLSHLTLQDHAEDGLLILGGSGVQDVDHILGYMNGGYGTHLKGATVQFVNLDEIYGDGNVGGAAICIEDTLAGYMIKLNYKSEQIVNSNRGSATVPSQPNSLHLKNVAGSVNIEAVEHISSTNNIYKPGDVVVVTGANKPESITINGHGIRVVTGVYKTITTKALTGNVATVAIATPHGLTAGDTVTVAMDPSDAVFDGTYVTTAVTSTTVSYAKVHADVVSTAATGVLSSTSGGQVLGADPALVRDGSSVIPATTDEVVYSSTTVETRRQGLTGSRAIFGGVSGTDYPKPAAIDHEVSVRGSIPGFDMWLTEGPTDEKGWLWSLHGNKLDLRLLGDDGSSGPQPFKVFRTGVASAYIDMATATQVLVPTATPGDNSTKAASTAFVTAGYQPVDTDLTAIAALSTTSYGRAFLTMADAAAARTALVLGTAATAAAGDFQPVDTDLTAIAALTTTAYGRSLLTAADAAGLSVLTGMASRYGDLLTTGQEVISRENATTAHTLTATGTQRFSCFTARKSETVSQIRTVSSAAAGATPTLCRVGLYTVAANGDQTLVASSVNDTSLWSVANTAYDKALSVPYAVVAGQRYAAHALCVSAASAPSIIGALAAESGRAPRLSGALGSQTDLPASILAASISDSSNRPYFVLLP